MIVQPPVGPVESVGFSQRWDFVDPFQTHDSTDVAAAFMDNDGIDGNGTLTAAREISTVSGFTGMEQPPAIGDNVIAVVGRDPHRISGTIRSVNQRVLVGTHCLRDSVAYYKNQTSIEFASPYLQPGDSGSPVLTADGKKIVGMINYGELIRVQFGGGTSASVIRTTLGFDAWYGTQTVPDRTIGVFRPSTHQWLLDNGSNRLDACGADQRYNDTCLGTFGSTGERPVVGNWTGRGVYTAGQYRIGIFSPAINAWILDSTGNGTYDDCNLPTGDWCPHLSISQSTDLPIVGDWNGDGRIKIGQFRPSTAQWFLDWNGNGVWN